MRSLAGGPDSVTHITQLGIRTSTPHVYPQVIPHNGGAAIVLRFVYAPGHGAGRTYVPPSRDTRAGVFVENCIASPYRARARVCDGLICASHSTCPLVRSRWG